MGIDGRVRTGREAKANSTVSTCMTRCLDLFYERPITYMVNYGGATAVEATL